MNDKRIKPINKITIKMEYVIISATLLVIDIIGYIIKLRISKTFGGYHLRLLPFIWLFYTDPMG